jgi:hypothetical protein
MKYRLFATKNKTAKENNLTPAKSKYYSGSDLFYDFSILDSLNINPADLDTIKADFMNHHAVSWYDQPLPLLLTTNNFTVYCGEIRTAAHRVYKSNGKRLMIIIEITAAKIEKQCRRDIWSEYKTEATYTARTHSNIEGDYEIA